MPESPTVPTVPPSPTVDAVAAARRAASFTTRSIKKSTKLAGLRLALSMTDLTTLEGKDSPEKVRSLCRKAIRPFERDEELLGECLPHVAAVCVYPSMVAVAREALDMGRGIPGPTGGRDAHPTGQEGGPSSPQAQEGGLSSPRSIPKVASVATGFPSGQYPLSVRLRDTEQAIADGADEIDMVINRGAFLSGRYDIVAEEIREVAAVCLGHSRERASNRGGGFPAPIHLKVILETGELETLDNVRRASDIAIANIRDGDFIKTSTGKVSPAATMPVTLVMLEAIRDEYLRTGRHIGIKPAGGIRTAKQSLHYLVMVQETLGHLPPCGMPTALGGHEEAPAPVGCPWLSPDLFRFGASSLVNDILRQLVKQKTGHYTAAYDFSEA